MTHSADLASYCSDMTTGSHTLIALLKSCFSFFAAEEYYLSLLATFVASLNDDD